MLFCTAIKYALSAFQFVLNTKPPCAEARLCAVADIFVGGMFKRATQQAI